MSGTSAKRLGLLAVLGAVGVATMACSVGLLLALAPALLIAALLLHGVFPGEAAIARIAARHRRRRLRPLRELVRGRYVRVSWRPAALLLATSLASRPPPAADA